MNKFILLIFLLLLSNIAANSQSPCLPGGITFTTQEQIDNFQANYPGCTEISGNVTISGMGITNLNGLYVLTSIGGSLEISNSFDLSSLSGLDNLIFTGSDFMLIMNMTLSNVNGLENLASIGGDLIINGNNALSSLVGLNNLTSVAGLLEVSSNYSLMVLTGLSNLVSIGGELIILSNGILTSLSGLENINPGSITNLNISYNSSLSNCEVQNICDYLASPNGTVDIYENEQGCSNPSEISINCGIPAGCLPYGNYHFTHQDDVDNFQAYYPGCSELAGNMIIQGSDITNLAGLNNVNSTGGDLEIHWTSALENLNGLGSLTSIGGGLSIISNFLSGLSGVNSLTNIGSFLLVGYNPALTDLSGLFNLASMGSEISINNNPLLTGLSGLENIDAESIDGLYIYNNSVLAQCDIQSLCEYLSLPGGTVEIHDNATGCNSPEEVQEHCMTDFEERWIGNSLTIVPNPSNNKIRIFSPVIKWNIRLSIFNTSGQKIFERQIHSTETQIDISALPRGVYFVRVQDEQVVQVAKMVKE